VIAARPGPQAALRAAASARSRPAGLGWRLFAAGAGGLALVGTFAALVMSAHQGPRGAATATFRVKSGLSVWTVEISADHQHMTVHAAGLRPRPLSYHYQLWALPEHGKPVSLVPLPVHGQSVYDLDDAQQRVLAETRKVQVTVEPAGVPWKGRPKVILTTSLEAGADPPLRTASSASAVNGR
jgi:anti-sigma-K factor RskA